MDTSKLHFPLNTQYTQFCKNMWITKMNRSIAMFKMFWRILSRTQRTLPQPLHTGWKLTLLPENWNQAEKNWGRHFKERPQQTSVTLARLRRVSFVILASFPMFKKWQFFIKLAMQHAYFLRYLTYFWLPKFKIVLNLLISIVASFYGCEFFVCVVDNIILQCSRFIKLLLPVSFIFSFIFLLTSVWVTYFINLCEIVLLMIYSLSFFLRISLSFLNFKE